MHAVRLHQIPRLYTKLNIEMLLNAVPFPYNAIENIYLFQQREPIRSVKSGTHLAVVLLLVVPNVWRRSGSK